jgi:flap endonuclease-1
MGVKLLSKLLKTQCYEETKQIHLSSLFGKKICIDVSIYLYRYKSQDTLIESFYLMCSLFKHYNITPIFIFDGKPPESKREELEKRKQNRIDCQEKYNVLKQQSGDNITKDQKRELSYLQRGMTKINWEDVKVVKELFDAYGIKYMTAIGEADVLCASLVIKKKVYAVLTEDMDLFAYTCPIVLRYFSLANHTCILYDLKKILKKLDIDKQNFRILCVLAGNDYYTNDNNIFHYLKIYNRYKKTKNKPSFMNWLQETKHLNNDEIEDIVNVLNIYKNVKNELSNYPYTAIRFGNTDKDALYSILERDRFVF